MSARRALLAIMLIILVLPALAHAGSFCSPSRLADATIREETTGFSITLTYPVLCAPHANQTVRDWVEFRLFDFKKLDPGHDLSEFPHKYDMHMGYAIWPASGGRIASVKIEVSVYSGGAHPNHWPHTWIFDLEKDEEITLEALFADLEIGLGRVSSICREVLSAKFGPDYGYDIESGLGPMERNFANCIMTDEGLVFFFAPYQVAPYSEGEQMVTIPYENLRDVLSKKAKILAGMLIP